MPKVPHFTMYSGYILNQLSWQIQQSDLLTTTAHLIAQNETITTTTATNMPTTLNLQHFGHFNNTIKHNKTALDNVISTKITYSNNLDQIKTIQNNGHIDKADPTITTLTNQIKMQFSDSTLVTQAINNSPCKLEFIYSLNTNTNFTFTTHTIYLPIPHIKITKPQSIQATFN